MPHDAPGGSPHVSLQGTLQAAVADYPTWHACAAAAPATRAT